MARGVALGTVPVFLLVDRDWVGDSHSVDSVLITAGRQVPQGHESDVVVGVQVAWGEAPPGDVVSAVIGCDHTAASERVVVAVLETELVAQGDDQMAHTVNVDHVVAVTDIRRDGADATGPLRQVRLREDKGLVAEGFSDREEPAAVLSQSRKGFLQITVTVGKGWASRKGGFDQRRCSQR